MATGYKFDHSQYICLIKVPFKWHVMPHWCHPSYEFKREDHLVKINRFDALAAFNGTVFIAMRALKFCKIIFNLNSVTATCSTCNSTRSMAILAMSSVLNSTIKANSRTDQVGFGSWFPDPVHPWESYLEFWKMLKTNSKIATVWSCLKFIYPTNINSIDINSRHWRKFWVTVKSKTFPKTFFMLFKIENITLFISNLNDGFIYQASVRPRSTDKGREFWLRLNWDLPCKIG